MVSNLEEAHCPRLIVGLAFPNRRRQDLDVEQKLRWLRGEDMVEPTGKGVWKFTTFGLKAVKEKHYILKNGKRSTKWPVY